VWQSAHYCGRRALDEIVFQMFLFLAKTCIIEQKVRWLLYDVCILLDSNGGRAVDLVGSQSEQNSVKMLVLLDSNGGRAEDLVGSQSEQNSVKMLVLLDSNGGRAVDLVGSQSEKNSVKMLVLLDSNGGRAVDLVGSQSEQNKKAKHSILISV
jgi:hypothetical protein